jgi:hypothetical protein
MKIEGLLVALIALAVCTGCETTEPVESSAYYLPGPERSKFLRTTSAGFAVDYDASNRPHSARYFLDLQVRRLPKVPARLELSFANPTNEVPAVVELDWPSTKVVRAESPRMAGFVQGRNYQVEVRVRDANTGEQLSRYVQFVKFPPSLRPPPPPRPAPAR